MKTVGRRLIAILFAALVLFFFSIQSAHATNEIHIDIVAVAGSFDINPALVGQNASTYLAVRATISAIDEEMPDASWGEVTWPYSTYRATQPDYSDETLDYGAAVTITNDPNSDGSYWYANLSASFASTGFWDVALTANLSFLCGEDLYTGTGTTDALITVVGDAPIEVIEASAPTERVWDATTQLLFPNLWGHETTYPMVVCQDPIPTGYEHGTPYEVFPPAKIDPPGAQPNGPGGGSTWAKGSALVDHIRATQTFDPHFGGGDIIMSFDQEWHDIRVENPPDNHDFTLNTDSDVNHWHFSTRNGN